MAFGKVHEEKVNPDDVEVEVVGRFGATCYVTVRELKEKGLDHLIPKEGK